MSQTSDLMCHKQVIASPCTHVQGRWSLSWVYFQAILQEKLQEGWDRSGPAWVLDISFNTVDEISIEKAMGMATAYAKAPDETLTPSTQL